MSLNELALFKNVKITPDYSVVHDMDPDTWKQYLMGELWESNPEWNNDSPEILFQQNVNYYRMPETIRVEGNFDVIRQATYGFLHDPAGVANPSFGTVFFFVNDVRLLKQHANQVTEGGDATVVDVCELDISIDVWSSYGGKFELYDSYVERRHMPRWKNVRISRRRSEDIVLTRMSRRPMKSMNSARRKGGRSLRESAAVIAPTFPTRGALTVTELRPCGE